LRVDFYKQIDHDKFDAHARKAGDYNLSQLIREVDTTQEFRAPKKFGKTGFEMLASAIKQRTSPVSPIHVFTLKGQVHCFSMQVVMSISVFS